MQIAYTPEQEQLRQELRAYFAKLMTPEVEAEAHAGESGDRPASRRCRQMGRDGWLGIGWPTEYGGQGRGDMEQFIFSDEAWRAGAPIPFLTINTVGKTIMQYGTEAQKDFFLPKILAGELHFAIGYTEPNAGTDLASLRTSAVKDGDEWRINGQKIYTSLASYADYIWLAARTDPDAPKHKGISIFCVPTTDPGFSYTKIHTMVNAPHVQHVLRRRAGGRRRHHLRPQPGLGPHRQPAQLRAGCRCAPPGMLSRTYDATVRWAQETKGPDGKRIIDQEWVRLNLATVKAKLTYLELLSWKVASPGGANPADAPSVKVFGTELSCEALPTARRGARPGGDAAQGLARRRARRSHRAGHAGRPDPHLRRRRQRGPARPHLPVRSRPPRVLRH